MGKSGPAGLDGSALFDCKTMFTASTRQPTWCRDGPFPLRFRDMECNAKGLDGGGPGTL
jgi:hypothetical protein